MERTAWAARLYDSTPISKTQCARVARTSPSPSSAATSTLLLREPRAHTITPNSHQSQAPHARAARAPQWSSACSSIPAADQALSSRESLLDQSARSPQSSGPALVVQRRQTSPQHQQAEPPPQYGEHPADP